MIIVETIADLKNLDTSGVEEGAPAIVASEKPFLYWFSLASATVSSEPAVVVPNMGPGQWVLAPAVSSPRVAHLTKNVAAGGTFVLSPAEYISKFIVLQGVLAAAAVVEFPPIDGLSWIVRNETTLGLFTVTLRVTGQVGGVLLGVGSVNVWSTGTALVRVSAEVGL